MKGIYFQNNLLPLASEGGGYPLPNKGIPQGPPVRTGWDTPHRDWIGVPPCQDWMWIPPLELDGVSPRWDWMGYSAIRTGWGCHPLDKTGWGYSTSCPGIGRQSRYAEGGIASCIYAGGLSCFRVNMKIN